MTTEPLRCDDCDQPWVVTRYQAGQIAVQPGSWWQPTQETWTASCACLVGTPARGRARPQRTVFAPTEGDLYRTMGYTYA